jgi:AraC family transcriptional regulator
MEYESRCARPAQMPSERTPLLPVTAGSPTFQSVDVGAFRVSDTRFPPGLWLEPHTHERTSFGVILEGGLEVSLAGCTHTCRPGCVETKPGDARHANRFGDRGARVLVVEPALDAAEILLPAAALLAAPHCFMDPYAAALALRLAAEVKAADELVDMAVEGLGLELLAHCARGVGHRQIATRAPRWLLDARDLLVERFRRPPRACTIARAVDVHPAYLARRFRAHFGTTMAGFVRVLRIEWAARRLVDSDDTIATIAAQAGFSDQSSLTRALRAHLGTTPARLRRDSPGH